VSSPHPVALKRAVLRDRDQRAAWLPDFLRYQVPRYAERRLTTGDGFEVERLIRQRSGQTWTGTREVVDTARPMRSAIQTPGVAHCALEYRRWAFRSQWRPDGRRFMAAMTEPIDIPVLQLHGEADSYLTQHTVRRSAGLSPRRTLVSIADAGHYAHQEDPE